MGQSARATLRQSLLARGSAFARRRKCRLPYNYGAGAVTGRAAEAERGDVSRYTAVRSTRDRQGRRRDRQRRLARGSAALSWSSCRLSLSWRGDARSSSKLGTQRGASALSAAVRSWKVSFCATRTIGRGPTPTAPLTNGSASSAARKATARADAP